MQLFLIDEGRGRDKIVPGGCVFTGSSEVSFIMFNKNRCVLLHIREAQH